GAEHDGGEHGEHGASHGFSYVRGADAVRDTRAAAAMPERNAPSSRDPAHQSPATTTPGATSRAPRSRGVSMRASDHQCPTVQRGRPAHSPTMPAIAAQTSSRGGWTPGRRWATRTVSVGAARLVESAASHWING